MVMNDVSTLQSFIEQGGPTSNEYAEFDSWVNLIAAKVHSGEYGPEEMENLRQTAQPILTNDSIMGFVRNKPYGYAGDFEIIDRLYTQYVSNHAKLRRWDEYSQAHSAAQAVRNRKDYFKRIVNAKLDAHTDTMDLLNVASGPARDLREIYASIDPQRLQTTCVEYDQRAIDYARSITTSYASQIEFVNQNIVRYADEKQYDLVWSAGLFDYFNDKAFVHLLRKFLRWAKPGGEVIIGNFSPINPSKTYMEIFGEWFLIHRSEEKLCALAKAAGAKDSQIYVGEEAEGVNLFLHIQKDA